MGLLANEFAYGTFGGADVAGADLSYNIPRTSLTVPTNAIQSLEPVVDSSLGPWGGFFGNMLQGVVGYKIARDMAQTQAEGRVQQQLAAAQAAAIQTRGSFAIPPGMLMLALGAGVVFLIVKAAK